MRKIKNSLKRTVKDFFSFCCLLPSIFSPLSSPLGVLRRGRGYAGSRIKALRSSDGQMALMMVLTTLMFLLIMVPVIEKFVQNEGKWSMKSRKTGLAFNLAESGVDRAYWKLIENSDNWDIVEGGDVIGGYANDKVYEDINGGSYKINMSSGDGPREVIVIGTGKDFSSKEYRAIKVVYSKESVMAALQAPVISGAGNANIFWGPIMSLSSLALSGGANELYPRKYARGAITANGIYPTRDNDPNGTNKGPYTDDVFTEWWSYNEAPGVPDVLTPDTSYYKQLSIDQALGNYVDGNLSVNSLQDNVCEVAGEPKVRFITGNASFGGNKYFCGVLIVLGELTFNSGGKHPLGSISVDPPNDAWKEYQLNVPVHDGSQGAGNMDTWDFSCPSDTHPCSPPHGDTDDVDEYPGDAGYHTVGEYNFKSGRVASGDTGGIQGRQLSFKGYIYAGTGFTAGGNTRIFGAVAVGSGGAFSGGGCDIFYDDMLDIKTVNNTITRVSWHEVTPVEF